MKYIAVYINVRINRNVSAVGTQDFLFWPPNCGRAWEMPPGASDRISCRSGEVVDGEGAGGG